MVRALRIFGYILLCGGFALIAVGSIGVLLIDGPRAFLWLFNPYNFASFLMNILTLLPGALLLYIANRLARRLPTKSQPLQK